VGENAFVTSQHWAAFSFWFTGYPDTALERSHTAVRMARRPDYAFSLCMALEMAAMLHQLRREPEQVAELAAEMQTLAVKGGLCYRQATAGVLLEWARSALGEAAGCHDLEAALGLPTHGGRQRTAVLPDLVRGRGAHCRVERGGPTRPGRGPHSGQPQAIICRARDRPSRRRAVAPGRRGFGGC
jgi:hypothetical protein